jgi:alkanesulfonate monooxygenase SsuD/methylene tetrahydromethanopterin reductase-like flavin-dependent oxidoreductase (luciferase family)
VAFLKTGLTAHHLGMWRHPETDNDFLDPAWYEHVARVREAARRFGTSELCPQIVGTPKSVADQLQDHFESRACNGGTWEQFARGVVPELQRSRGLFRAEYTGRTLREHLHD